MFRKIKKIRLMNFQIHKSFILDNIDEGMVALVGQSSSGKTAVLRAIQFCLYNQMPGNSVAMMTTHGETHTEVEIAFDDGLSILRVRDIKSKDNYYVIQNGEEMTRLDTPGAGPVKEVVLAHGMRPISFLTNKDILNYSSQHDEPFFINASPQERLRAVGILSNTEIADAGIKLAASQVRENKKTAAALRKTLVEKNARLKEIGPLKQRKAKLEKAKGLISTIQELDRKQEALEDFALSIERLNTRSTALDDVLLQEDSQNLAGMYVDKTIEATEQIVSLAKIRSSIENAEAKIQNYNDILDNAPSDEEIDDLLEDISKHLKLTEDIGKLNYLEERIAKIKQYIEKADQAIAQAEKVNEVESAIETIDDRVEKLKQLSHTAKILGTAQKRFDENETLADEAFSEYNVAVDSLINAFDEAGVCPLCESDLTEESAKKIIKEYELT